MKLTDSRIEDIQKILLRDAGKLLKRDEVENMEVRDLLTLLTHNEIPFKIGDNKGKKATGGKRLLFRSGCGSTPSPS